MEHIIAGIPVFYETYGEGKPLLVLHGRGADHRTALTMMEPLFHKRLGWQRIYPDLPGMGQTPGDAILSHDDMLTVIFSLIEHVAPTQNIVVAGISYGGYLARGLVHHHSEKIAGLLLVVPSVERDPLEKHNPAHAVRIHTPEFDAMLKPEEEWLRGAIVVQTPTVLTRVRDELLPALSIADQALLQRLDEQPTFSFDVDTLPHPLLAPTLILTGRQDSTCGYQAAYNLLDNYPNATFAVIDAAGHMLHREQTALFEALANNWLDSIEMKQS